MALVHSDKLGTKLNWNICTITDIQELHRLKHVFLANFSTAIKT